MDTGGYSNQAARSVSGLTQHPSPARAVNPSCFGTLEDALSACIETANRVEHIADRLCGSIPAGEGKGNEPAASGLFAVATIQASVVRAQMARMNEALSRIENQLP